MAKTTRQHQLWNEEDMVHFITTKTHQEHNLFTNDVFCLTLWEELFFYSKLYNIDLLAFVIMPNHLHCLIFPQGEKTFSDYMCGVKGYAAREIVSQLHPCPERGQWPPPIANNVGTSKAFDRPHRRNYKHRIWQSGFFDYIIWSIRKLEEKLWYIQNNPVRAGLVKRPEDYPWLYVSPKIYELV